MNLYNSFITTSHLIPILWAVTDVAMQTQHKQCEGVMRGNYIYNGMPLMAVLKDLRDELIARNDGGFTVLYDSDNAGRYVIGVKGFTVHIESFKLRHIEQIAKIAAETPGVDGFGAWINNGVVYLDAIRTAYNKYIALYWARRYDQLAIYDSVTGASIYLNSERNEQ